MRNRDGWRKTGVNKDRSRGFLLLLIWDACPANRFWLWPLIQCKWGFHHTVCYCTVTLSLQRLEHHDNVLLHCYSFASFFFFFFSFHSRMCVVLCQFFLFFHFFIICLPSISVFMCKTLFSDLLALTHSIIQLPS